MTTSSQWLQAGLALAGLVYAIGSARAQTQPVPQLKPSQERSTFQEKEGPPRPPPQQRAQQRAQRPHLLPDRPQGMYCWYVPNGAAITIACANGFWQTILPDGTVVTGNGMDDPNATAGGSGIVINPATGGPAIGAGQTVRPPTQVIPTPGPGQANRYGLPYTEE